MSGADDAVAVLIDPDEAVERCREIERHMPAVREATTSEFLIEFTPGVARIHARIVNDFFRAEDFAGTRIMDIGPGLYPFAIIARALGAEVVAIEFDEALADLGRRLGFEVHGDDLDMLTEGRFTGFDGLFLKGPFNPCRQSTTTLPEAARRLDAVVSESGWGWMCNSVRPWTGAKIRRRMRFPRRPPRKPPMSDTSTKDENENENENEVRQRLGFHFRSFVNEIERPVELSFVAANARRTQLTELQRTCMQELGWTAERPDQHACRRYALTYLNRPYVYTKGLRTLADIDAERMRRLAVPTIDPIAP